MRITRIAALGTVTLTLWGLSSAAAFADDTVPVDPPPAVEPAPAVDPPPTAPPVSPPIPVETPDEYSLRTTGYTLAQLADQRAQEALATAAFNAQSQAWQDRNRVAIHNYLFSHMGAQVHYNFDTGILTDENGNLLDLSAWDTGVMTGGYPGMGGETRGTPGMSFETGGAPGVSDDASIAELEGILAGPMLGGFSGQITAPTAPGLRIAEPPVDYVPDTTSPMFAALASWVGVTSYALWRRRYRALELLAKARGAAAP